MIYKSKNLSTILYEWCWGFYLLIDFDVVASLFTDEPQFDILKTQILTERRKMMTFDIIIPT